MLQAINKPYSIFIVFLLERIGILLNPVLYHRKDLRATLSTGPNLDGTCMPLFVKISFVYRWNAILAENTTKHLKWHVGISGILFALQ